MIWFQMSVECYDISSAGHIPAGMDFIESASCAISPETGSEILHCFVKPRASGY
jgi:hypothetical protein